MPTRTNTTRQSGIGVVDPRIALTLVRYACQQVPDAVPFYMDSDLAPSEPAQELYAQLGAVDLDMGPGGEEGATPGADIRGLTFFIDVHTAGYESGQRTSDHRLTGAMGLIMHALEARSFVSTPITTPPESEPAGEHTLEISRCRTERMLDMELRPVGVVRMTFAGKVTRTSGDGMLGIPT